MKLNAVIEPLTETEPVNSEPICEPVLEVFIISDSPLDTEAVAEPLLINVENNASGVKAERGIFLKKVPSP